MRVPWALRYPARRVASTQDTTFGAIRARELPELWPLIERVKKVAEGAALMTETSVEMQVGKDLLLDFELVLGETRSVIEVTATTA